MKLGRVLAKRLIYNRGRILAKAMAKLGRNRTIPVYEGDYFRLSSLGLAGDEVHSKGLIGNVAELGVFKGDFAKWINQAFPDRKLYLFDTFEGFDERDARLDRQKGYSLADEKFNTSVESVMKKMKYPDNCIVRKGWFPESADGVSDKFVFVSIDVDLYQAILSGLEFFYPLLVEGGYIFVHDNNNKGYKGVKPAVREYCAKANIGYFPLTDGSGSAVIAK